jgi:leucyl-tRNA synthetase
MELTNTLRKAIDSGAGAEDPAVREGAEELAKALSLFAPYTAEDMWQVLGHSPSVALATFRTVEKQLLVNETITAIVQVDGKLRDKFEVPVGISEEELRARALASSAVMKLLAGSEPKNVIVRAPKLVNIATK